MRMTRYALVGLSALGTSLSRNSLLEEPLFDDWYAKQLTTVSDLVSVKESIPVAKEAVNFDEYMRIVHAGIPVKFEGAASDEAWDELRDMTCRKYAARWPDSTMRAEYTGNPGETYIRLGDVSWITEETAPVNHGAGRSKEEHTRRPFVWHVKDQVSNVIKKELQTLFPGLSWVRAANPLLDGQMRDSMEFWFQPVGAGTFAHNDAYCNAVMSIQLRGRKKWKFMFLPDIKDPSRRFDEYDGGIYASTHSFDPPFETVLNPGDAVLFHPGYLHETLTMEQEDHGSGEDCSVSVTVLVPFPLSGGLISSYLPRLSASQEVGYCLDKWQALFTLNPFSKEVPMSESMTSTALDLATTLTQDFYRRLGLSVQSPVTYQGLSDYVHSQEKMAQLMRMPEAPFFSNGDIQFPFLVVSGIHTKHPTPEMVQRAVQERVSSFFAALGSEVSQGVPFFRLRLAILRMLLIRIESKVLMVSDNNESETVASTTPHTAQAISEILSSVFVSAMESEL